MLRLLFDAPQPGPTKLGYRFSNDVIISVSTMTASVTLVEQVADANGNPVDAGTPAVGYSVELSAEELMALLGSLASKAAAQAKIAAPVHLEA